MPRKPPPSPRKRASRKPARAKAPRAPASPAPVEAEAEPRKPSLAFPVVGIGASAGGLEAFQELFPALPADSGMAFVVVQHLAPTHASLLAEILRRVSRIPVDEAKDRMPVAPNHVYVIPPDADMVISGGVLRLSRRREHRGMHRPIDAFFRSLAEDQRHLAIAVILSGSANDGTLGCQEIKGEGGITLAQDDSAQHRSMPRSAVAAGCVDSVLPPAEIGKQLALISRHPSLALSRAGGPRAAVDETRIGPVLDLVRKSSGVDFSNYKRNTLQRRITRRMVLSQQDGLPDYLRMLAATPAELEALYQDILINVTSFFRNPDSLEKLKTEVFQRLTHERPQPLPLRFWVPGCSTGEEAYSIAMSFAEFVEAKGSAIPVQIFASDLNAAAIEKARAGVYSKTIAQDVSSERLRRFFVELDGSYRISKPIRDMVIFARHNALTDPPFGRMDLISCRNLLIYLEPVLQNRLLPILHYALRPGGFLFLGNSESIGSHRELFEVLDNQHKLYRKKAGSRHAQLPRLAEFIAEPQPKPPSQKGGEEPAGFLDTQREVDRVLLGRFAPAGVLVTADFEILHFRGDTAPYLAPAPGKASLNLLKMLREGLLSPVRSVVQKARREDTEVRQAGLQLKLHGILRTIDLEVIPIRGNADRETCYLVLFVESGRPAPPTASKPPQTARSKSRSAEETARQETSRISRELEETREYLQSVIEQHEAANEELQSANEEVQSANEELQSINEELETSQEEIQSSNEELATVNDELRDRNRELNQTNSDLLNLMAALQMAILILGPDLRIRRITPASERLLNLLPTDIGRPIGDIKLHLDIPDLEQLVTEVVATATPIQRELQNRQGRWFLLWIRPYRTLDNQIGGAILALYDIDELKQIQAALHQTITQLELVRETAPIGIREVDVDGRYLKVNDRFCEITGYSREELLQLRFQDITHPDDVPPSVAAFRSVLAGTVSSYVLEKRYVQKTGNTVWVEVHGSAVRDAAGVPQYGVGFETDITDRKHAEAALHEAEHELRNADRAKNEFLAMLAHELRNPLAPLRNVVHLLTEESVKGPAFDGLRKLMERQIETLARLVDDLLDVSRITQGKLQIQLETVDLGELLQRTVEAARRGLPGREQTLSFAGLSRPVQLRADPIRLEQAFGNLLTNASKFSPDGGDIEVQADSVGSEEAPEVEIRVKDNGGGIDPEVLPTIFDAFIQGDRRLDRSRGGLGLGLTLVKRLVELHGGSVEARSEGRGKGSEFIVRLPALAPDTTLTPPPSHAERRRRVREARRILVVDDNADSSDSLALLLRRVGHVVEVRKDGPSAIELAVVFRPDVVLLDIGLPGLDGFAVARALRQRPETSAAMLIGVSGYGQEEARRQAQEAGFDAYFTKPMDWNALQDLLRQQPDRAPA